MGVGPHLPQQAVGAGLGAVGNLGVGLEINRQHGFGRDDKRVDDAVNAAVLQGLDIGADWHLGQNIGGEEMRKLGLSQNTLRLGQKRVQFRALGGVGAIGK